MRLTLGSGAYRIELELNRAWGWYRLPFIGQGHWDRKFGGWTTDGWAAVKHT